MKRKNRTTLQKVKLFDAHHGTCCICHFKINASLGDKWIIEHIKPLWLDGEDDDRNLGPAHEHCARDKTSAEAPVRAKSNRIRARHLGAHKPRQIMPGSKASKFKKRMDGRVELRNQPAPFRPYADMMGSFEKLLLDLVPEPKRRRRT